jgi:hypothetical protein
MDLQFLGFVGNSRLGIQLPLSIVNQVNDPSIFSLAFYLATIRAEILQNFLKVTFVQLKTGRRRNSDRSVC